MYCTKCGKENPDDFAFCVGCGSKLMTEEEYVRAAVESLSGAVSAANGLGEVGQAETVIESVPKTEEIPVASMAETAPENNPKNPQVKAVKTKPRKKRKFVIPAVIIAATGIAAGVVVYIKPWENAESLQGDVLNAEETDIFQETAPFEPEGEVNTDAGVLKYTYADGVLTIVSYEGTDKAISIDEAFSGLFSLDGEYTIVIGEKAFFDCESLTELDLGKTRSVMNSAFEYCSGLASVSLENVEEIAPRAFRSCSSLKKVSLPKVTRVENFVFAKCGSLAEISLPVAKEIDNQSFCECESLSAVELPMIESIGKKAFGGCVSLTRVTLGENAAELGDGCFADSGLTELVFTGSGSIDKINRAADSFENTEYSRKNGDTFKTDNGAFTYSYSSADKTVTLIKYTGSDENLDLTEAVNAGLNGAKIESIVIGENCFSNSNIVSIDLGWQTRLSEGAFSWCSKLHRVDKMPDEIPARAFEECTNLEEVTSRCRNIGDRAFYDCEKLKTLTIPFSTNALNFGDYCFAGSGLEKINFYGISQYDGITVGNNAFGSTPWEWQKNSNNPPLDKFALMAYSTDCIVNEYTLEVEIVDIWEDGMEVQFDPYDSNNHICLYFDPQQFLEFSNIDLRFNRQHLTVTCIYYGEKAGIRDPSTMWAADVPYLSIISVENADVLTQYDESNYLRLSDFSESEILSDGFAEKYRNSDFVFELDVIDAVPPMVAYGYGSIFGKIVGTDLYAEVSYTDSEVDSGILVDKNMGRIKVTGGINYVFNDGTFIPYNTNDTYNSIDYLEVGALHIKK